MMKLNRCMRMAAFAAAVPLTAGVLAQTSASSIHDGSDRLRQAMQAGMGEMSSMKPTGDVDKDFAMMMKAHHQQAVDMAKIEMEQGQSPQFKAMAAKMMKDQKSEIEQMDDWLKKHP